MTNRKTRGPKLTPVTSQIDLIRLVRTHRTNTYYTVHELFQLDTQHLKGLLPGEIVRTHDFSALEGI